MGVYRPRQLSLSGTNGASLSSGHSLPSPRTRTGAGVDGVMGESWMRRRTSDRPGLPTYDSHTPETPLETHPEHNDGIPIPDGDLAPPIASHPDPHAPLADSPHSLQNEELAAAESNRPVLQGDLHPSIGAGLMSAPVPGGRANFVDEDDVPLPYGLNSRLVAPPPLPPNTNESVQWRYKDNEGLVQGEVACRV